MPSIGRYPAVSWIKRYAISCLIALFIFSGIDSYKRPTNDVRVGVLVVLAAVWPVTVAVAVGSAVGEVARERA